MNEWLLTDLKTPGLVIAFVVIVPFLISVILFETAYMLSLEYTAEKAMRHLERQLNSGLIDWEHYKSQIEHIQKQSNIKLDVQTQLAIRKTILKQVRKQQAIKQGEDLINNLQNINLKNIGWDELDDVIKRLEQKEIKDNNEI